MVEKYHAIVNASQLVYNASMLVREVYAWLRLRFHKHSRVFTHLTCAKKFRRNDQNVAQHRVWRLHAILADHRRADADDDQASDQENQANPARDTQFVSKYQR